MLENVTPHGGTAVQSWKQTYSFDRYGNRRFDEPNTTTLPKNCGTPPNQIVCPADVPIVNSTINTSNNRLSSTGWQYDAAGNTTADPQGRTFIYDAENKQVQVTNSSGVAGQYFYNGDGLRIKKVVPSTGETTVFVYDASNKLVAEYSTIVEPASTEKTSYLTNDHLGSPRINTEANGNVIARHDYLPFGEEIYTAERTLGLNYAGDNIRQKFTAYERDIESDLDFAQARYYNFNLGKFTTTDPLLSSGRIEEPHSWNLYTYVLNNPLVFIDSTGAYECDASASKSCEKFEKVRQELVDARDYFRKVGETRKANALTEVLKAIGTMNDKNGLIIAIGKVPKGAAAETKFGLADDGKPLLAKDVDGKGNYVANVIITFRSSDEITLDNVAHEGSHAVDRQKLIAAMFAENEKDPFFDDEKLKALPENLTRYATESKAYHISSYIQEYMNTEGEYWKRGWREVDRQKAIDRTLLKSDLYKVTPKDQGNRLYETAKKP